MADRVRSLLRIVGLIVAAALALTPSAAFAQDLTPYRALVDRWLGGDVDSAANALARWPRGEVTAATKAWVRTVPADQLRTPVMLHTDLAYALTLSDLPSAGTFHMTIAQGMVQRMVQHLTASEREVSPAGIFARRWHEMAAAVFTGQGLLNDADWVVRSGLSLFPRASLLFVARGVVLEERIALNNLGPRAGGQGNFPRMTPAKMVDLAAADYRHALQLDEANTVASLRLAWLHLRSGDGRAARELDAALEHATDDRLRYVAHLLRGQAAELAGHLDAARENYEAALAAGADYQTGYVAVSRVYEALGLRDRARAVAQDYAMLRLKAEDPWWDFHLGGFDTGTLTWLRAEARRP